MTITVKHIGLPSQPETDEKIENEIIELEDQVTIEEARVRLERRHDENPPYVVSIHLVTPGPDFRVDGRDHTLDAAIKKAAEELRRRIGLKGRRRVARAKSNLQMPASSRLLRRPVTTSVRY